ncbi:MAG: hypothetical protein HYW01_05610 [Deltaproteobacteria bacterium]|nr:hypothetical protein [Deltaproteobacteria bacterium]
MSWPMVLDYEEAIQNPNFCFSDLELKSGISVLNQLGLPKSSAGSFAQVFQINCNVRKYAVKCFTTKCHPDLEQRYAIISKQIKQTRLPYIISFEFIKQGIKVRGQWYPILKMEWIEGEPLNTYIEKNLSNKQAILNLAKQFYKLISELNNYSIAHGDLQDGNIFIVNEDIRLIDYDGMFVPGLEGMPSHELGHRNYQHPRRTEQDFGPSLDNFSAWVIYLSLVVFSIEPSLWHRLGAGEEHLLFRREDFENPHLSETLRALEQIRDSKLKSLVTLFRSFMYLDLSQIPPLDGMQDTQVISTQVSSAAQSSWLSDYANFDTPTKAPNIDASSFGQSPSWILDYMEPVSPISLTTSSKLPERISIVVFAITGVMLIYATIVGLIAPVIGMSAMSGEFSLLVLILILRYRFLSTVSKKSGLLSTLGDLQKEIKNIESVIKQLFKDKNKLDDKEGQKVREITSKQSECSRREKSEIDKIENELQSILIKINSQRQTLGQAERKEIDKINFELQGILTNLSSQRQALNQEETNEIAQELRNLQSQFYASYLSNYDLNSASISGIGSELTNRLVAKGIRTAADISKVNITQTGYGRHSHHVAYIEVPGRGRVHVEGIGPKKAKALLSWLNGIKPKLKTNIPQSLPSAQEASIRSKYRTLRQTLDSKENDAKQYARQMESTIKSKYQTQYQPLDLQENNAKQSAKQKKDLSRAKYEQELWAKELNDIRDHFAKQRIDLDEKINKEKKHIPEKSWKLAKIQRELDAYNQVNFTTYLKNILFLSSK